MEQKSTAFKLLLAISLLFLLCILGIGFSFIVLRGTAAILITADPLEKADAAVALTGDQGDRVSEAARLYKNDYVEYLYITFTDPFTRDMLIRQAVEDGIPSVQIEVTSMTVSNTVEEAYAIKDLSQKNNVDSLIIITDPYHTLRTRIIFRREFRGSSISIQVRPVVGHWYRSDTWWKTSDGIQLTLEEYLKIFLYYFGIY